MVTPIDEKQEHRFKSPSTDDDTMVGDGSFHQEPIQTTRSDNHIHVLTDADKIHNAHSLASPSQAREQSHRLADDLAMLQVEREITEINQEERDQSTSRQLHRSRSRQDPVDDFDVATEPIHNIAQIYKPPEHPTTSAAKFFKKIHESSFLIRYFTYIFPIVAIILIPLLLGIFVFKDAHVGGVDLPWFCIWLEIIWTSLWAGRILAKCLPWPIGTVSSIFTNNAKKWRDMGKQLELPATLFFWWLAIEVSFLPTMINHHVDGSRGIKHWESTMNKVLVALFVGFILNFAEKIIIQLIAISFHLRTYQDRIDVNKFQIGSLTKLYEFSKKKITMDDSEFEQSTPGLASGARTPGQLVKDAQKNTREAFSKIGDVAGKIAGDFTGKEVLQSTHPHQVILTLLGTTNGSQVLARRLYRTFAREDSETVFSDDLKDAFQNEEEAEAAFSMFDKDMNGDISMEELEAVCVEIGRERKSITASLKDLDSVVSKLDDVFMFIIVIITILVFISLISTSAAGVLTSAGSTVLALSWLFSATAQEFLQSVIFVFVKHPFDVGDRVGIYGNTGALGMGDDYFVKEIALLYTEFKKMEGHIVQAPNSYLNTLFILNQRRSGGLAEAVPVIIKFGTTLDQIDQLRQRLLEFVITEKREYQPNILTELREVMEAHAIKLNVVFFYKTNWQNELLRLQRRNRFICALMVSMQEIGIEGPRMRYPGQKESFPVYLQNIPHIGDPNGILKSDTQVPPSVAPTEQNQVPHSSTRARGETLAAMGRRVDFSLGMKDVSSGNYTGDVFEDDSRSRVRIPAEYRSPKRRSQDQSRVSGEVVGRSSSISSSAMPRLNRIGTDTSAARNRTNHRNRFFGRNRGQDDEAVLMESGMADIPENRTPGGHRIDPRSGMISPAAVRIDNQEHAGPSSTPAPALHHPARSMTDSIEMTRIH
ncbi:hypothetical protein M501DRAFT_997085 [Patellaria atrata CBS 101060]|uniref:EF-hand domain-containing protein n=1 Tax=Patellaria atrata CBS 101060 TaxID=1346257 RepID=A0A9P4S503_9PEZI|nr:hypothetical protein M501DRAFT_997085 [Patellaria atrata CBS 101060]